MHLGISGSQTSEDFFTYYLVQKIYYFYFRLQFVCSSSPSIVAFTIYWKLLIVHLCFQKAQQEELDKIEKHMKSTKEKENAKPLDKPEQ